MPLSNSIAHSWPIVAHSAQFEKLVTENILGFDQKFWIRVATRNDAASTAAEKDRLPCAVYVCALHSPVADPLQTRTLTGRACARISFEPAAA